jgi:uroporphyrinogen-III decarboxylase
MTNEQWSLLLDVVAGKRVDPPPVGFVIDSPWLPGWSGISTMDYYAGEAMWLKANLAAVRRFPQAMFLPGFWSEYGMCTEPSAFGARCTWAENDLPFAHKLIETPDAMTSLHRPDPRTDGLLPFVLKRLQHCQPEIEKSGHAVHFAAARGPWNIASFLMGTTEFLMGLRENSEAAHALLKTITDFLVEWLQLQAKAFPTIDGIFILDDIIGFVGEEDLAEFGLPYLKRVFQAIDASVRFFHNDAAGLVCAPHLAEIGVNLFNFSFEHSLAEMKRLAGDRVTLLGNIPPRHVLAAGSPNDVRKSVRASLDGVTDTTRIILSAGGGMPPGVPTANIEAFIDAVRNGK